jgi:hypothetical protein
MALISYIFQSSSMLITRFSLSLILTLTYSSKINGNEEYTNICDVDVFSIRWLLTDWHINPLKHAIRLSYIIGGFSPHLLAYYICTTNILISLCVLHSNLYFQRVSLPLKKRCDIFTKVNAAHPARCDSPLQIVISASNLKKKSPNCHCHLQRAVTPYQITKQNCLQRVGGP